MPEKNMTMYIVPVNDIMCLLMISGIQIEYSVLFGSWLYICKNLDQYQTFYLAYCE